MAEYSDDIASVGRRAFDSKLESLALFTECGHVGAVACCLGDKGFVAQAEAFGGEAWQKVENARDWLTRAEASERENGPGSRIDRAHPWNVKHLPAIEWYWRRVGASQ